ncbi:hypothetical protein, conserved [Leishmania lindenbergi]|uniref:Uncharacterized protein n=1 Tax=Leishmania lindenbergi TaxID=651832 RepID=A0AAW3A5T0_9TRYP
MCAATAQQFRSNPLFRVLAFLDNTGAQAFALDAEVDADGDFRNPDSVFATDSAITGVLTAALDALRANVRRLFADAAEQHALLAVLGAGAPEPPKKASLCITTIPVPLPLEVDGVVPVDVNSDASLQPQPSSSASLSSLPISTPWSEAVLHPTSLAHYADNVENEIPIHLLVRLHEVLGISAVPLTADDAARAAPSCYCTCSPFVEQLLIDGLDEWLHRCPIDEVKRMVLACGVQPTVWESTFTQQQQQQQQRADAQCATLPDALADFVVDVVFPVPAQAQKVSPNASSTTTVETVQDWLILSFEKNREAVDLEDDDNASANEQSGKSDDSGTNSQGEKKRIRTSSTCPSAGDRDGLGSWEPIDGEEVLTAENIDRYLLECPQRIPKEILRAKRKRISDAGITAFELEHHYTAAELKKLVKEGLGTMTASEATDFMGLPVTEAQVQQAARLTRKAQLVEWILTLHKAAVLQQSHV